MSGNIAPKFESRVTFSELEVTLLMGILYQNDSPSVSEGNPQAGLTVIKNGVVSQTGFQVGSPLPWVHNSLEVEA